MNIVLLHGWGGSQKSLTPLASELEHLGHNTLVFEMPGHGSTPEMASPWNMSDFANWAKEQITNKGFNTNGDNDSEGYVLLGHSFGGKIIMELLSNAINNNSKTDDPIALPSAIVFVNANGIKPKNSIKRILWKILSLPISIIRPLESIPVLNKVISKAKYFVYRFVIRETDYYKTENKKNLRASFKLFNNEHYNEKLDHINSLDIPTLILWGRLDKATPLWMGETLHKNLKNSKLVVMDSTHGLPLKQPKEVALEVNNFLNSI